MTLQNNSRVLVTGGTGFLGAALVRALVTAGHRVRILDNNLRGKPRRLGELLSEVELIEADIRDSEAVANACRDIDTVAHLAFINGTETFYSQPGLVMDVGVRGMLTVLDGCAKHSVASMMLMSSSEVYQRADLVPTPEDVPLVIPDPRNPRYSYGGAKAISELLALHGHGYRPAAVRIVRPHNVYGPDMGFKHVIPQLSMRISDLAETHETGEIIPLPIRGDGRQTRAFVHVDDFTDGLLLVMQRGEDSGIYHIGTSEEVTIADLAHRIAAGLDREVELIPSEMPVGETDLRCPDIGKLESLGYQPTRTLSVGVTEVARWYRDNRHLHTQNEGDLS